MQFIGYRELRIIFMLTLASALVGCGGGGGGGGGGSSDPNPHPINQPPSVSLVTPSTTPYTLDVKTAQYLDITVKADDPDGGKLTCIWAWDAGSITPYEAEVDAGDEVTARFTPPNYDGTCKLTVSVNDGETSAMANMVVQVTGHNVDPGMQLRITDITMVPDPVAPSGKSTLTATVQNPSGKPLTYLWKTKYGSVSGKGTTASWTAPNTSGIYGVYLTVNSDTEEVTSGKAVTVSGPSGGLKGEYFKTRRDRTIVVLDQLVLSRIDPTVNFAWEKLSPAPDKLPSGDGWGGRWTGYFKGDAAGIYNFSVWVDDGARMKIKDDSGKWVEVIPNNSDNWVDHTEGANLPATPIPVELEGGKWYPLQLEFFEGGGDAFVHLYWSVNGSPKALIPQASLKPPS